MLKSDTNIIFFFNKMIIICNNILLLFLIINVYAMTKEELDVLKKYQELCTKFYEKQTEIDEQQRELYSIAKDYYDNKFPIFKKGNFYLSISKTGTIDVYYQRNDFYLWINNRTTYDDENDKYIVLDKDNLIEGQFSIWDSYVKVNTTGINYKYNCFHKMYADYNGENYFLFNESNANEIFNKYGFKKPKLTKQGIISLFNKMNEKGDIIPISKNGEENNYSKELLINFYKKEKAINKQQQDLYFIAKQYYDMKFLNLQKGNIYLTTKWGQIRIFYQPNKFKMYRLSRTFYSDRQENRYRHGENIIEENFSFDCPLNYVVTKGISDRYERSFHNFNNDDDDTFLLFNESNAKDIFNKYGFRTYKINKDFIQRLFIKIKEANNLTPISITIS